MQQTNSKIRVSVITPFHNVDPEVFASTAQSLLAAAEDDWEWIVVLHNTNNITASEVRRLVGNDRLLSVYEKRDDRHTPSSPRNLGLKMARGTYVYFLDADDLIEPGFIPETISRMEKDGADIGIGRVKIVHCREGVMRVPLPLLFPYEEGGYTVGNDPEERGKLLFGAPMMLGSKVIRRALITDNGIQFDEEISLTEDVIFMLKCCVKAQLIRVYKDLTAYRYVQRDGSLLQNMIFQDDSDEEIYLKPLRKIVSLCMTYGFSPGLYLWGMFGLFGSIFQNEAIGKEKRTHLMEGIQEYLPLLSKKPPEGIGKSEKDIMMKMQYEELMCDVFSQCDGETFRKYFLGNVFKTPEKTAVEWRDSKTGAIRSLSYWELAKKATALAAYLYEEGCAGQTVAIAADKSAEWIFACVACFTYGITFVPIDQTCGSSEIIHRVSFCQAYLLFTDSAHCLRDACPSGVKEICLEDMKRLIAKGEEHIARGTAFSAHDLSRKETDRSLMIFTSGTGGKTKCAVLLEKNLTPERFLWTGIGLDRYPCLSLLPFCHVAGIKDIIGALITGTSIFVGSDIRYLIDDYLYVQPVCVTLVPLQAKFYAKLLEGKSAEQARDILGSRIKVLRLVGAPVSESLRELYAQWDIEIHSNYGLSETCGTLSCSYRRNGKIYSKPGSVGRVIDGVDVKIDKPDANGNGEILVKGQIVFDGYLNDAEETAAVFSGEWLKTGDIGHMDEDRCLYIRGRKKNIIVLSNGENIVPEELERKIAEFPYVKECLVFEEGGMLCVRVVLDPGENFECRRATVEDALRNLNKELPFFMRLEKTEITDVPLLKTASGKIIRGKNA